MTIDDGSLLAYCGIGFGTLFASYAMMLDTEVSQKKFARGYLKAAFYNSIRMTQFSSAAMMGCCFLLLLCSVCSGKHPFLSEMATWVACWATLFAIVTFSYYYWDAFGYMRDESNLGRNKYDKYKRLNSPPKRR